MADLRLIEKVIRQRVIVLAGQFKGCDIECDAKGRYGKIRVAKDDRPVHFEIALEDNNFDVSDIKTRALTLAQDAPVTILVPDQDDILDQIKQENMFLESVNQITTLVYGKSGEVLQICADLPRK